MSLQLDYLTRFEDSISIISVKSISLSSAIFSATKTAIGTGMLFLPYAMMQVGIGNGVLMLIFAAVTTCLSIHFLASCAYYGNVRDYIGACFIIYRTL